LYGHPDAGGFWEEHCEERLNRPEVGFVPIKNWRSCFWHPQLKLFLVVYVDDFKMAGPTANLKIAWDRIASVIKMEPPAPVDRYLGCHHRVSVREINTTFQPRYDARLDLRLAEEAENALKGRICKQGKQQRYKKVLAEREEKAGQLTEQSTDTRLIAGSSLKRQENWHIYTNCVNLIAVLKAASPCNACSSPLFVHHDIDIIETIQGCAFRLNL
jgi:hypothetical protein